MRTPSAHPRFPPAGLGLALLLAAALATAAPPRQLGKHEHGAGTLNVAVDGPTLTLELDGPADNLLGFEHPPGNAAEQAAYDRVVGLLRDGRNLFQPAPAARCQPVSAEPELPDWKAAGGAGHADLGGSYEFRCANPAALAEVEIKAFHLFPGLHTLAASVVGPDGQTAATLTPAKPRLTLKP